jgi:phospholipase C
LKRLPALSASAAVAAVSVALLAAPASATPAVVSPHADLNTIQHIVVLFPENHSFDNYFGVYPKALNPAGEPAFVPKPGTPSVNGLTATLRKHNTNLYNPYRIDRLKAHACSSSHAYTAEQLAADRGKMDRYVQETGPAKPTKDCPAKSPMGYYDGNTVTALWNYAQNFSLSDNTFGTTYGPSTVGAINLVSGQTHGAIVYGTSKYVANGTLLGDTDPYYEDCSKSVNRVALTGQNIGDLMTAANITWGWFEGGFTPSSVSVGGKATCATKHKNRVGDSEADYEPHHEPFQYYLSTSNPHHLPPTSVAAIGYTDQANHQYDLTSFWAAAANGTMPAVSFLKPPAYQDGHPGSSDPLAEQTWLVTTLNRLQKLPDWQTGSILVVLAWDDSGGWYDHVYQAPINSSRATADGLNGAGKCGTTVPTAGAFKNRCGYGPRLPLLVISPYARENYVDHSLNDQTSIIRLIEQRFALGSVDGPVPPATGQQSYDEMNAVNTGSLLGMLDFTSPPRTTPVLLNPSTGLPQ